MKIFGRDPALWIGAISSFLVLLIGLGVPGLNDHVAGGITATLTAGAAVFVALQVRPIAPTVFTGFITTAAALVASFGFDLPQAVVGATVGFVTMAVSLAIRSQSTPLSDPKPGFLPIPDVAKYLASLPEGKTEGYSGQPPNLSSF